MILLFFSEKSNVYLFGRMHITQTKSIILFFILLTGRRIEEHCLTKQKLFDAKQAEKWIDFYALTFQVLFFKTKANIQGIRLKNCIFQVIVSAILLKMVALLWCLKYTSEMIAFNFGK